MESLTLKIEPMHCGGCVSRVVKVLGGIAGLTVMNVTVGSAALSYDTAMTSQQQIVDRLKDQGFTAEPLPV
jgi:copper chaperone